MTTTTKTKSIELPPVLYANIEEAARHYAERYDVQNGKIPLLDAMIREYVRQYDEDFVEKEGDEWSEAQYVYQGEGPPLETEEDSE